MRLRFNEAKATQAAALMLKLRGSSMSYLKLIKLLYLADREALLRWGRPVTTDSYVSMDNGPVVSRIYNLIREEPEDEASAVWRKYITEPRHYEVALTGDPGNSELSRAEEELMHEVFDKFGRKSRWELRDYSHSLPEWNDPNGSAIPISVRDILRAGDKTEGEIAEVEAELENLAFAESLALF
jgi:uncharacterized phage-associated protein